ncbi:hypothetical protein Y032_0031g2244 [Ancylostoma ceylanicum]|uniref:ShKT domain-containing protein n=1 Tax=Ancylostoma ceylanicum TaxID=53326 RepID=A0A016URE3_9BILA|nr:hypothetical protein Y032_0031g2244 [Ancylostoma ceylanicum]
MRLFSVAVFVVFFCIICFGNVGGYKNKFDSRCSGRPHLGGRRCTTTRYCVRLSQNRCNDCKKISNIIFSHHGISAFV